MRAWRLPIRVSVLLAASLLWISCSESIDTAPTYPGGPAVCESGPAGPSAQVTVNFSQTQAGANAIKLHGGHAYVVESLNNTVSRVDLESGRRETWVDVGNDRNPYDIWITDEHIYVANYVSNSVSIAATATGEVLREITSPLFLNPSGVARLGDRIYVSNVNYQGPGKPYGEGSIVVMDERFEVLGSLPTAQKNPQYLSRSGSDLIVVDSGEIRFEDGVAQPGVGAVEFWTPSQDWNSPQIVVATMEPRGAYGAPGRPSFDRNGEVLYVGSGTAPAVFSLGIGSNTWLRGSEDPILLPGGAGNALTQTVGVVEDVLYAVTFNDDALFAVDLTCDKVLMGPIDLGHSTLLEGPIDAVIQSIGDTTWVTPLMSLSNSLGHVEVSW